MNDIRYRKLIENDVSKYRNIRLELLKKEPQSFGSSYEEESKLNDKIWIDRLTKEHINVLGAFDKDILVGICISVMNPRKKIRHLATLNSMYVQKEYRKLGIGKKLITNTLNDLKRRDIEIVNLSVVTDNTNAIYLYKSLGFSSYGIENNAIKINGKYSDLLLMSINL